MIKSRSKKKRRNTNEIKRDFRLTFHGQVEVVRPTMVTPRVDILQILIYHQTSQMQTKRLLNVLAVTLRVISAGCKINLQLFDNCAVEPAKLFVLHYTRFYLPAGVHKVLLHGALIIENALLPIGLLSGEAQEARNRDIKKYIIQEKCHELKPLRIHSMIY